jgi:2-polyprenyl-6-hydroxyphenyl methylase / 3-demethylubiquinone-9 3-methyltransferase
MLRKDQLKSFAGATADPAEVARFERLADEWWKPDGAFKVVHNFNAARVAQLAAMLPQYFGRPGGSAGSLKGLTLVDVGCGAGLVAEPMARLGADVLGIDAAGRNIAIAERHAAAAAVALTYRQALPEALVAERRTFDIVLSLEVVEHVADVSVFLKACAALVAPGGILVIGTLNRTARSYALAIVGAEYVLGWLPKGTHDWNRFVTPDELRAGLMPHGLEPLRTDGVVLNPLTQSWRISRDSAVNYMSSFARRP